MTQKPLPVGYHVLELREMIRLGVHNGQRLIALAKLANNFIERLSLLFDSWNLNKTKPTDAVDANEI